MKHASPHRCCSSGTCGILSLLATKDTGYNLLAPVHHGMRSITTSTLRLSPAAARVVRLRRRPGPALWLMTRRGKGSTSCHVLIPYGQPLRDGIAIDTQEMAMFPES